MLTELSVPIIGDVLCMLTELSVPAYMLMFCVCLPSYLCLLYVAFLRMFILLPVPIICCCFAYVYIVTCVYYMFLFGRCFV